ncbi:MAG: flagellar basal body-associated protein FliL [Congregibacter sp.]
MASNDNLNLGGDQAAEKSGGKGMKIIIIVLLLVIIGGGAAFFLMKGDADDPAAEGAAAPVAPVEKREPYYAKMKKLLVNLESGGRSRYVQVELQLMSYTEEVIDQAYRDMPAIRDRLIILYNDQDFVALKSPEGKDALRVATLETVNLALELTPPAAVDQVYFENFVLQ